MVHRGTRAHSIGEKTEHPRPRLARSGVLVKSEGQLKNGDDGRALEPADLFDEIANPNGERYEQNDNSIMLGGGSAARRVGASAKATGDKHDGKVNHELSGETLDDHRAGGQRSARGRQAGTQKRQEQATAYSRIGVAACLALVRALFKELGNASLELRDLFRRKLLTDIGKELHGNWVGRPRSILLIVSSRLSRIGGQRMANRSIGPPQPRAVFRLVGLGRIMATSQRVECILRFSRIGMD